jgi:hypothetical protein
MGETTTLALNAPNKASLRTTIPMFIVKQWGLQPGQQLDWSYEKSIVGELVVVVRKVGQTDTQVGIPHDEIRKQMVKERKRYSQSKHRGLDRITTS